MKIHVEWTRPVRLEGLNRDSLIYTVDLTKLPRKPGIYVFGRRFGSAFEALYVGRARRIRDRVKDQLNQVKLMQHVKDAKAGKRVVLAGRVRPLPGQQLPKILELAERALIRHFLSEGHDLVNKSGIRVWRHKVLSSGKYPKRSIPLVTYLEKAKGK